MMDPTLPSPMPAHTPHVAPTARSRALDDAGLTWDDPRPWPDCVPSAREIGRRAD